MSVRPYVQKFHSSEYINALANGDICVAFGWSGDVLQARDRAAEADNGVEHRLQRPDRGRADVVRHDGDPGRCAQPDGAHKFLNFIMDAENMAQASNYVYYANGNKASQEYLNEDVIGDPAIYPSEAALDNTYIKKPYDGAPSGRSPACGPRSSRAPDPPASRARATPRAGLSA